MAFADLLDHDVYIRRTVDSGSEDDYGHPVQTTEVGEMFDAAIQPKTAQEAALTTNDGTPIGDWTIFLTPRLVTTGDVIVHDTDLCAKADAADLPTGRYEITAVLNETGRGHHLALDARLIGTQGGVEGS